MPDSIAVQPIQQFDASKGLSTIANYLGVQQRQQDLQTGQYQQATAKADSEQATQKNAELQAANNLAINGAKSGKYTKPDGSFDRQAMADDITKVAPTYGQGISNQLLSGANEIVANKQAIQNLTDSKRKAIGGLLQSLAGDPDVDNTKIIDGIENLRQQYKDDPEMSRLLTSTSTHLPASGGPQLRQALATGASTLLGEGQLEGTTNAAGNIITRNKITNQLSAAPGSTPDLNPSTPQVAASTARGTGTAGTDIDRSRQVSSAVQGSSAAIPLTQHIDDLAEQIHSGKFAAVISKAAASAGLSDSTYARQVLEKELGQVKAAAISNAPTDNARSVIESGYPTPESDTQTIHTAMDYTRGVFRQNVARNALLTKMQDKDPSIRGFQHADDILTRTSDPLMHEFMALKPSEVGGFYQRNFKSAAEAQEFKNKVQAFKNHTNVTE